MNVGTALEMDSDALNSAVEIIPDQGRNVVVSVGAPEGIAYGCLADCLDIGRRKPGQALNDSIHCNVQLHAVKVFLEQALAVCRSRGTDFDLFRQPATAQNRGIDPIQMIGGSHEKDVVFRKKLADLGAALFDELSIMRAQHAVVSRKEAVDFVEENDRRIVFSRARE